MTTSMETEKMDVEFCEEFVTEITQSDIDEAIAVNNGIQERMHLDMDVDEELQEEIIHETRTSLHAKPQHL